MYSRLFFTHRAKRWSGAWLASGLTAISAHAATVQLLQDARDDASGATLTAVQSEAWLESGFSYKTNAAPAVWYEGQEFRFTHWSNASSPASSYRDAWGRSSNPISFVLLENTLATAHYLPVARDSDSDGLPDWFEMEFFGTLAAQTGGTDADGDGRSNAAEFAVGTHPRFPNHTLPGGIRRGASALITCNFEGFAGYSITSNPAGIVNEHGVAPAGTAFTTPDFGGDESFAYWTLDGVRQEDAWGRAVSGFTFVIADTDRVAVAHFLVGDGDGDGVSDAWEQRYLGTLGQTADSDSDGDGISLRDEYLGGTDPRFANSHLIGGIAHTASALLDVDLGGLRHYVLRSEPAGIIDLSDSVSPGTAVTSPYVESSGFVGWTLDGIAQLDDTGVGLRQISFTVNYTDREGVATFANGDSDSDGLPDAWELFYLSTLSRDANDDSDRDGLSLADEYSLGSSPIFATTPDVVRSSLAGGISHASSAAVLVNLQFFERLGHVLVENTLSELYSFDPLHPAGWNFGPNASPAVGDWDADGRDDLFVVSDNAIWVLQNTGSAATPAYRIRGDRFGDWSGLVAGVRRPAIALGDWSGDDRADLVLGGDTGTVYGFVSAGTFDTGQTTAPVAFTLATGASRTIPALGDVNGDGRVDLLVMLNTGSVLAYLHGGNNTAPYSAPPVASWLPDLVSSATGIAVGDIDGDGRADVLVSDTDGRIWEFHGRAAGGYTLTSKVWAGSFAGFASNLTLTVADLNADGHLDAVGGTADGALIGLRDPRLGAPGGLALRRGGQSIELSWNSDNQYRLRGYRVYRSVGAPTGFTALNSQPLPFARYVDSGLSRDTSYHYRVTGVSAYYMPGESIPHLVESAPSETVSTSLGGAEVRLRLKYQPGRRHLLVQFAMESSRDLQGAMEFVLRYDPAVLTPLAQAEPGESTVRVSGLARRLELTDDGATASGTLNIQSLDGNLPPGRGLLIEAVFVLADNLPSGTPHGLALESAMLLDGTGQSLTVELPPCSPSNVDAIAILGDLNADGARDDNDLDRLSELILNRDSAPSAAELEAGDLNADGVLDQSDVVLLRRELAGKKNTE